MNSLKKIIISILIGSTLFTSCRRGNYLFMDNEMQKCVPQTVNPDGRSYSTNGIEDYSCTQTYCGIIPLNNKNYWIYEDSIFSDGSFLKVQFDTLHYQASKKTLQDGLVWWQSNLSVGLPAILYSNDSSVYSLSQRLFVPGYMDVKKQYGLFEGDSIKYLTNFDDAAAIGKAMKLKTSISTSAGVFNDCLLFEANAYYYRKDQVIFKPGFGVIKYIQEKAPLGERTIKLQQISTLIAFHFE